MILGYPELENGAMYNSCALISEREIVSVYRKKELPNYGVFDEKRYFKPGSETPIIKLDSIPLSMSICEDIWSPGHAEAAAAA